jgi:hypothetical protein
MKAITFAVLVFGALLGVFIGATSTHPVAPLPLQPLPVTKTVTVTPTPPVTGKVQLPDDCGRTCSNDRPLSPTGPCGYTIGCQETVPGVPQVPRSGSTTEPFPYQDYFCANMRPVPPGCSPPNNGGHIMVGYRTAPYSCSGGDNNPPPGTICSGSGWCFLGDPFCSTTPNQPGTRGPNGYTPPCYGQSYCGGRRTPGF